MVITDNRCQLDATHLRATLRPEGEIDAGSIDEFAKSVQEAVRSRPHELVVDLGDVAFMDTAALNILEQARDCLELSGAHLCVRNARPQVHRLLSLTAFAA